MRQESSLRGRGSRTAGDRDEIEHVAFSANGINSWVLDFAHDGDPLGRVLKHENLDVRIAQNLSLAKTLLDRGLHLFRSESLHLDGSTDWQSNVAVTVHPELPGQLRRVKDPDFEHVTRIKKQRPIAGSSFDLGCLCGLMRSCGRCGCVDGRNIGSWSVRNACRVRDLLRPKRGRRKNW